MNGPSARRTHDGVWAAGAAAIDDLVRGSVGYRVIGPDGDLGVVAGVPEAGLPPRPLVLVIRAGDTFRFLSLQRVERVVPSLGELIVRR
jgi:hypothetical protein